MKEDIERVDNGDIDVFREYRTRDGYRILAYTTNLFHGSNGEGSCARLYAPDDTTFREPLATHSSNHTTVEESVQELADHRHILHDVAGG